MRSSFFQLDMPLHEELTFYKWTFGDIRDESGPRVGIVTGVHGDELSGPFIAWKLIRFFQENPAVIGKGSVVIIPASSPMAINVSSHHWPFDQTDLNSLFPGYREGETTQRVAAAIFEEVMECDFCINIQSGTNMLEELPQVRLYEPSHSFENVGASFGLPVLWKRRATHPLDKTLFVSQLGKAGVPAFSIHAGAALRLDPESVEHAFEGILNFLAELGILKHLPSQTPALANDTLTVDDDGVMEIVAPEAGLFVADCKVGVRVGAGDLLGRIVDPCTGGEAVKVFAPVAGLVITIKVHPLAYEGDLLSRIVMERK